MSYKDNLSMRIATSNSCEIVALQYEAMIEEMQNLRNSIKESDSEKGFLALDKIRDILSSLIASLDNDEKEFKQKTTAIYLYANEKLNKAYFNQDPSYIDEIESIFEVQKNAWLEAGKKIRQEQGNKNNVSNSVTYGKTDVNVFGSIKDFGRG